MSLLKIGTYTVPDEIITKLDATYAKIYASEEQLENGTTYTEQVRNKVPALSVELTNVESEIVDNIVNSVDEGQFNVEYCNKMYTMRVSGSIKIALKCILNSVAYYDLSFKLEG